MESLDDNRLYSFAWAEIHALYAFTGILFLVLVSIEGGLVNANFHWAFVGSLAVSFSTALGLDDRKAHWGKQWWGRKLRAYYGGPRGWIIWATQLVTTLVVMQQSLAGAGGPLLFIKGSELPILGMLVFWPVAMLMYLAGELMSAARHPKH